MKTIKRKYEKCPPEFMVNVNTDYLRYVIGLYDLNLSELSVSMGYCPEYLSNAIGDGRMNREHVKMLSEMMGFPYKKALATKNTQDDLYDLLGF
jgi:hypothetical protein